MLQGLQISRENKKNGEIYARDGDCRTADTDCSGLDS